MAVGNRSILKNRPLRLQLSLAVAIVIIDQFTKWLILSNLQFHSEVPVTQFLNLVLVYNKGAAFGFLANSQFDVNLFFLIASLVIVVILMFVLWTLRPGRSQSATAIWLIISGALGNIIDRIVHGHVIDFIDFHYAGWHYSAFNVADSAITIGAILIAMEILGCRLLFRNESSKHTDGA